VDGIGVSCPRGRTEDERDGPSVTVSRWAPLLPTPDPEPTMSPGPGCALTARLGHALMDGGLCTDGQRRTHQVDASGARERPLGCSRCRETTPVPRRGAGDESMPLDAWTRGCMEAEHVCASTPPEHPCFRVELRRSGRTPRVLACSVPSAVCLGYVARGAFPTIVGILPRS